MAKSITVKPGKRGRGRPATGGTPFIGVRLPSEWMRQLDEWAAEQGLTRSAAIRKLIELGWSRRGAKRAKNGDLKS